MTKKCLINAIFFAASYTSTTKEASWELWGDGLECVCMSSGPIHFFLFYLECNVIYTIYYTLYTIYWNTTLVKLKPLQQNGVGQRSVSVSCSSSSVTSTKKPIWSRSQFFFYHETSSQRNKRLKFHNHNNSQVLKEFLDL